MKVYRYLSQIRKGKMKLINKIFKHRWKMFYKGDLLGAREFIVLKNIHLHLRASRFLTAKAKQFEMFQRTKRNGKNEFLIREI